MNRAFATAYPASRGPMAQVFRPVVEPRSYLRFIHLALMMPLGLAYFTFFVTAFATGGSLVWTFIGPPILLGAMYLSLMLADLELWLVNFVWGSDVRRPPQRLEGVNSLRQKVWARIIDPSTWTGLVYEIAQFPVGIAAFVGVVFGFFTSGYLVVAPLIIAISGEPVQFGDGGPFYFDEWFEALPLVPLGMLGWILTVHVLTAFSALHAGWAHLMLGSRARHVPPESAAIEAPEPETPPPSPPPLALLPPAAEEMNGMPPQERSEPAPSGGVTDPAWLSLTAREREVTLLLARGFSNADIAEHCYISEGTVKTHVLHVLEKLNVRDRTQVVIYAYERGLVRPGGTDVVFDRDDTALVAAAPSR